MEYFIKHNKLGEDTKAQLLALLQDDRDWALKSLAPSEDDTEFEVAMFDFISKAADTLR